MMSLTSRSTSGTGQKLKVPLTLLDSLTMYYCRFVNIYTIRNAAELMVNVTLLLVLTQGEILVLIEASKNLTINIFSGAYSVRQ